MPSPVRCPSGKLVFYQGVQQFSETLGLYLFVHPPRPCTHIHLQRTILGTNMNLSP